MTDDTRREYDQLKPLAGTGRYKVWVKDDEPFIPGWRGQVEPYSLDGQILAAFTDKPIVVWSKNSSILAVSKKRKFFNGDEFIEGRVGLCCVASPSLSDSTRCPLLLQVESASLCHSFNRFSWLDRTRYEDRASPCHNPCEPMTSFFRRILGKLPHTAILDSCSSH